MMPSKKAAGLKQCAKAYGFENVDYLFERVIYCDNSFNALVIIDEIPDELETVIISRFRFPLAAVSLHRLTNSSDERIYQFESLLAEISDSALSVDSGKKGVVAPVDPSDTDTVVVPVREENLKDVFLGENRWYSIRMHASMILRVKYIAAYQSAPCVCDYGPCDSAQE